MTVVADSYGAAKKAGGPAKVAGSGISDVVIAADWLLRWHGYRARGCATHDTMGTICLVSYTGVGTWTHHIRARLLALSLVHNLQVWVSHAASHQKRTLILIRLPVTATHSMLPGNVRAVWIAHTLRSSHLHFANFPRTAFDSLTCFFTRFAGDDSQEAQQADFIHGQAAVGPGRVQTAPCTALLSGHSSHQHHVTPLVLTLLQPAYPTTDRIPSNLIKRQN